MYIITEDSNSARDFWQCVAQTFRSVDSFLLVSFPIGSDGQTASGNMLNTCAFKVVFPEAVCPSLPIGNDTNRKESTDLNVWATHCQKSRAEFESSVMIYNNYAHPRT